MPAITIQSLELRDDQKEILADKFTSLFSELTKVPKDRIYVFFAGYDLDNAASNGSLFRNHPPANLVAKFNEKKE
jgi:phenylpyruvate tautomerase PptA (4-oxalocrotonate tautomerase family)